MKDTKRSYMIRPMITMENKYNQEERLGLLGVGLIKIPKARSKIKYEIIFQKGIGIPIIQNLMEMYRNDIIRLQEGHSIVALEDFTLIYDYFNNNNGDIYVLIFMDDNINSMSYTKYYLSSKTIL